MSNNFSRSRTRKFLYQLLYASTFDIVDLEKFKESFFSWIFDSNIDDEYLSKMYKYIIENQQFLTKIVVKYAPKFDIQNMDLSIVIPVFIWTTELIILENEIPLKVSINEAVEISKVYWDDSSRKTVNWILNKVVNDLESLSIEFKNFVSEPWIKEFFKKV